MHFEFLFIFVCCFVLFRQFWQLWAVWLKDPITTEVTGPWQGQGESRHADWKSGASDLVMESEIWWTVLFRQQSIFLTLSSLLKDVGTAKVVAKSATKTGNARI